MEKKIRIGVLMGGRSAECEVSFNSGRTICDHIDGSLYETVPLFQTKKGELYLLPWRFLHRGKISDFEHKLVTDAQKIEWDQLKSLVDIIYPALHGRYGEDGILQGTLEMLGLPYVGSKVLASALGMDKVVQKEMLQAAGILVPQGILIKKNEIDDCGVDTILERLAQADISLPCIVKPRREGSSCGVSVVNDPDLLITALKKAGLVSGDDYDDVLIEERINGMEFSCIILTNNQTNTPLPLPITEILPEGGGIFDYEQKYMPGRATKFTPARCSAEVQKALQEKCVQVATILGITTIARIDGFLTNDGRIIIIDPNTLSGMGPTSFIFRQAAELGMGHTQVINHIIETELEQHPILNTVQRKKDMQTSKKHYIHHHVV